ncbi:MAG TPA: hypothetical protein DC014_07185 [Treponema sp.]|nr:hypothetical protein [Treponema sp.]
MKRSERSNGKKGNKSSILKNYGFGSSKKELKTITKEPGISNEKFEETLNLIGQKGWEASGTFSTERGSGTMFFKRPKGIIEKKNQNSYSN